MFILRAIEEPELRKLKKKKKKLEGQSTTEH